MKDALIWKIMTKFVWIRAKTFSCLRDDSSDYKKAKSTRKCITNRKPKIEIYKICLEATQLKNKINYLDK